MNMNRIFAFLTLFTLVGCTGVGTDNKWHVDYTPADVSTPARMQYGTYSDVNMTDAHRMAVLLPLSGDNAPAGRAIATSIEIAAMQSAPENLAISFYDTATNASDAMNSALAANPEIIVGPIFANNARTIREMKTDTIPVLAFTSDESAIGNGVMSMSLMPNNGVEAIVKQMPLDSVKSFVILAPDTQSGRLMAGAAVTASEIYNIPTSGIFYYTEKDSESIKSAAAGASMNTARTAAHTRAREILADILTNERLTAIEKSSLNTQLEKLSRTDTLGKLPYNAVLFLGNGDDTKNLASFLRYYGVGTNDAIFYGTALWDGTDIASDFTLSGAKYPALSEMSTEFIDLYEHVSGTTPSRLAAFGYDAANMAIGTLYSQKSHAAYLLDPSGYIGTNGLVRLRPAGMNERALRIMQLNGSGTPTQTSPAATNFMTPLYNIEQRHITPADAMALETRGVNPLDYINIPERYAGKYRAKTFGANMHASEQKPVTENTIIVPSDEYGEIIEDPDFKPVSLAPVSREYIESVEIIDE